MSKLLFGRASICSSRSVYLAGTGPSKAYVLRQFNSATPMYLPPFFFVWYLLSLFCFVFASIPPTPLLSRRTITKGLINGPSSARNQSWRVREPIHQVAQHPIRPKLLEKDPCRNTDIQIKRGRTAGGSSTGKPGHVLIRPIWDSHMSDQRKYSPRLFHAEQDRNSANLKRAAVSPILSYKYSFPAMWCCQSSISWPRLLGLCFPHATLWRLSRVI